jgi:hypothetical protein
MPKLEEMPESGEPESRSPIHHSHSPNKMDQHSDDLDVKMPLRMELAFLEANFYF